MPPVECLSTLAGTADAHSKTAPLRNMHSVSAAVSAPVIPRRWMAIAIADI
jgi:hypothetical protein